MLVKWIFLNEGSKLGLTPGQDIRKGFGEIVHKNPLDENFIPFAKGNPWKKTDLKLSALGVIRLLDH